MKCLTKIVLVIGLVLNANYLIYAGVFTNVTAENATVGLYEKFELSITLNKTFANPYNYDLVNLYCEFWSPSGKYFKIDGFYYKGVVDNDLTDTDETPDLVYVTGSECWKVRFTPSETGIWSYRLSLNDAGTITKYPGTSTFSAFQVSESTEKGFIKIKNNSPRAFAFSDNEPYYPIGTNQIADHYTADSPLERGTKYYEDKLNKMQENGINYFRLFIGYSYSIDIWGYDETFNKSYHKFYNQKDSWQLDRIFELAEERKINLQITLFLNYILDETHPTDPWNKNPSNKNATYTNFENAGDNKGNLNSPYEFFTNAAEIAQQTKYIRYVLSRWGYATNLFNIELFNETDNFNAPSYPKPVSYIQNVVTWHSIISNNLKQYNAFNHLVTTSFTSSEYYAVWNLDGIDIVSEHCYFNYGGSRDIASALNGIAKNKINTYNKPYLIGEFAYKDARNYQQDDPKVYLLHCSSWTTFFGGLTTPSFWEFWHLVNYSFDARNNSLGISEYTKNLPIIPDDFISGKEENKNGFDLYYMRNPEKTTFYGYIQDHNFSYDNIFYNLDSTYFINYSSSTRPSYASTPYSNRVKIGVGANTKYEVKWFNTITGEIYKTENIQAVNNQLELYHWPVLRSNRYADAAFIISNKPTTGWVESEVCPEQWHSVKSDSDIDFNVSGENIYYINSNKQVCGLYKTGVIWGDTEVSGDFRTKSGEGLIYDKNTQCTYYVGDDKIYRNYYSNGSGINEIVCPGQWNSIDTDSKLSLNASGGNIYYVNTNKQICTLYKNGTTWSDAIISGSNIVADGRGIIYSLNDDCLYYIRSDKKLYKLYYSNSSWVNTQVCLGQWTFAHTNSELESNSRNSIYYLNENRQVCSIYKSGTSWGNTILCESAVKAKAGSNICYYAKEDCLFYIGEDSYIYKLYWESVWKYEKIHQDNFGQTLALYNIKIKNDIIYYVGNDYKIHSFKNTANTTKSYNIAEDSSEKEFSTEKELVNDISLYPNPVKSGNDLNIASSKNLSGNNLNLYNSNGSLVKNVLLNSDNFSIKTDDLQPGLYLIKIVTNQTTVITKKIIITE